MPGSAGSPETIEFALDLLGDAVVTADRQCRVRYLNPAAARLLGIDPNGASGRALEKVLRLRTDAGPLDIRPWLERCLVGEFSGSIGEELVLANEAGECFAVDFRLGPLGKSPEHMPGVAVVLRDVTAERAMRRELSYHASYDTLTGLVNRAEFERRLRQALRGAKYNQEQHAVCYLDLDQFKIINDTCGHVAGDEMLRQVATLLKGQVRATDTLARLGGDEFGVLLSQCPMESARRVADNLRESLEGFRFSWQEQTFAIGASIGMVAVDDRADNLETVLSAADTACYAAKEQGRNRVWEYKHDDHELLQRHGEMQWVSRITQALEEERFVLYGQPIMPVRPESGEGPHYEILIRMRDERGEMVPPMAFIPAAERYNLMTAMDRWVVNATLCHLLQNPRFLAAMEMCSINVSGQSLCNERFLAYVVSRLQHCRISPRQICFEITETAAIGNLVQAKNFISTLKHMGCRFALDDFGSGLSSFGYLKNLPVDFLKIDGLFVKDMVHDPIDRAMVESIHRIGRVLGIKTVAEFVEDAEILEGLREIGVNYAQGFGVCRPLPLLELLTRPGSGG